MRLAIDLDGVLAANRYDSPHPFWHPDHWVDLDPIEGAVAGMVELYESGHKLHVVTARNEHENTYQWLAEHFGAGWYTVHHTKRKYEVPCHAYLDDREQYLKDLWERKLTTICYAYPYNVTAPRDHTVSDWPQYVNLVQSGQLKGKLRRRTRQHRQHERAQ